MTTFIALPDLHGHSEQIKRMARPLHEADFVLLPGDLTNGSQDEYLRLLNSIEGFNENIYAIPGNMDTVQLLALMARDHISLHRRSIVFEDFALLGVGGALPFYGKFVFSEEDLAGFLEDAARDVPPDKAQILVCHQPPHNTICDTTRDGQHVGSHAVRAFIERRQPLLCFTGHIHEGRGVDQIGRTHIINPGPITRSNAYAFAEIEAGQLIRAEIRAVEA